MSVLRSARLQRSRTDADRVVVEEGRIAEAQSAAAATAQGLGGGDGDAQQTAGVRSGGREADDGDRRRVGLL